VSDQSLAEIVAKLREKAYEIGAYDEDKFEVANAARERGLKLDSYWAGAIDAHHVSSALFLHALDDLAPEPENRCPECGQVRA
jgi:hypothetical protein